jgi:putative ABC transport system permease protein
MLSSWQLARSTLAGRPVRTLLMIGAIALSAALVVTVACAIASSAASMQDSLRKMLGASDARIIHPGNGRFDAALLETVRAWPEVDRIAPRLWGALTLVRTDGGRDPETSRPRRITPNAVGVDFDVEMTGFRSIDIVAGHVPSSSHEVLLDPIAAEALDAKPGDQLVVQRFGNPIELVVSGIYERQRLGAVQRGLIMLDRSLLAEATDKPDELTSIMIILREGEEVAAFCRRHQHEVPGVLTLEPAEMVSSGFDRQMLASRFGLRIASVLTFMCSTFIIVTALTTSVTEKEREMAIVRCIGASRAQLFGAQLFVGLSLGALGAIIGTPIGLGLGWLLVWRFSELLPAGLHVEALGLQLALIGSLTAGLIGAVYPAWMASRVPPLQAMSIQARPPRLRSVALTAAVALVLIGLQVALWLPFDPQTRFQLYVNAGLPSVHVGYFLLAIPLLAMLSAALAPAIEWLIRLPRGMLRREIAATPFRHGFTAGAMMVGISILVSTWSNTHSLLRDWIGRIRFPDGLAYRNTGISPSEQRAIAALPFVTATCPIGYLPVKVVGRQMFGVEGLAPPNILCIGFDPRRFFDMTAVTWVAGDPQYAIKRLTDGDAIVVADRFLITQKAKVGDTLTLASGRVQKDYEIVGAMVSAPLDIATQIFGIRSQYMEFSISCVFMDFEEVVRTFDNADAYMFQVNLSPAVDDQYATRTIEDAAPGVRFRSGRWILDTINKIALAVLAVQSTIAFAALGLACLGVGNVIMANIHGRRYEFGVLRAVGAQRGLVARLILAETALLAITGAIIGTMLGMHLAWIGVENVRDLAGLPVRLAVPVVPTAIGWIVLAVMTMLAALPGIWTVIRPRPSALLAAGRSG